MGGGNKIPKTIQTLGFENSGISSNGLWVKKQFRIRQPLFEFASSAKDFILALKIFVPNLSIQKLLGLQKNHEAEKVSYHALN